MDFVFDGESYQANIIFLGLVVDDFIIKVAAKIEIKIRRCVERAVWEGDVYRWFCRVVEVDGEVGHSPNLDVLLNQDKVPFVVLDLALLSWVDSAAGGELPSGRISWIRFVFHPVGSAVFRLVNILEASPWSIWRPYDLQPNSPMKNQKNEKWALVFVKIGREDGNSVWCGFFILPWVCILKTNDGHIRLRWKIWFEVEGDSFVHRIHYGPNLDFDTWVAASYMCRVT